MSTSILTAHIADKVDFKMLILTIATILQVGPDDVFL